MANGDFVWTDLSTYDPAAARADYGALFGWRFQGGAYDFAYVGDDPVAAVFEMPERLAAMNMPSFWMSYIHVADLDGAVAKARRHDGAIIEVAPEAFGADARIALVRDPSGAGFTMHEGPDIAPPVQPARFHHAPDVGLIAEFYTDLFGWTFHQTTRSPWPVHAVRNRAGDVIAHVEEVPERIRGAFRYWMPCFVVVSLAAAEKELTTRAGGFALDLEDGRVIAVDRQGAHFMLREG